jgi:hypothetical protein
MKKKKKRLIPKSERRQKRNFSLSPESLAILERLFPYNLSRGLDRIIAEWHLQRSKDSSSPDKNN